jgi:hypothetical protein
MPILAGPRFDRGPGGPIQVVGAPGCAVLIAIDLGGALPVVDHEVAERWECTVGQLMTEAMSNLEQRAARIRPDAVCSGSLSGHAFRFLDMPRWCSSLVLVPGHLTRLFGSHDQTIATPATSTIVSLAPDVPSRIVAEIVVGMERREVYPLLIDPFLLEGGQLTWDGVAEWDDDDW